MDIKDLQQQNRHLLISVDDESNCNDTLSLNAGHHYWKGILQVKKQRFLRWLPWTLHITGLLTYTILIFMNSYNRILPKRWPNIYENLTIREHFYETSRTSHFQGRPSKSTAEAWHNLLNVGIVSITSEERSLLPFETAPNPFRENEYVVELNIFHQLHCLHGLRQQLYNPQQLSWQEFEPVSWWEFHMDHCIEHLRESLMCNADISPQRFDWDEERYMYMLDQHQGFPECKNWADIWNWAESRNNTGDTPMNLGEIELPGPGDM